MTIYQGSTRVSERHRRHFVSMGYDFSGPGHGSGRQLEANSRCAITSPRPSAHDCAVTAL